MKKSPRSPSPAPARTNCRPYPRKKVVGYFYFSNAEVSCWTIAGERQAARIRGLYLKAIPRQDMAFFDTETTTGEVIWRMSGDTGLVQDAMGENVGKFLQFVSTFFAGLVIAFVEGRQLALVMVFSLVPLLAAGAASAVVVSKMSGRAQSGNADAGDLVEQTVGSIRTVSSSTPAAFPLPSESHRRPGRRHRWRPSPARSRRWRGTTGRCGGRTDRR